MTTHQVHGPRRSPCEVSLGRSVGSRPPDRACGVGPTNGTLPSPSPAGEEAAWGGYLVLADSQAQAEAWAQDCLWFWDTWSLPFGQGHPPLDSAHRLKGD